MKGQEIKILGKSYSFFTDEPEYLAMMGEELNAKMEELKNKYSQFSRDHLLLLYLLRKEFKANDQLEGEPEKEEALTIDQTSTDDQQLDLEIDDILNTEL